MQWYLLLGISNGMRTMTPMAVLCWFAWLRLLPENGWAFWSANLVSAIVFTVMAVGEYYGDTLPRTGNRTSLPQLVGRLAFGGLAGALAAHGIDEPIAGGILFSWAGVFIGAFGGIRLRLWAGRRLGRDLPAALGESALSLGLAVAGVWMVYRWFLHAPAA